MSRVLIIAVVVLGALFLITVGMQSGATGLDGDDAGRLVYYALLVGLVGSGILASQKNLGEAARNLGIWALIILVLASVFVFKDDAQGFASRLMAGLVPGRASVYTDAEGRKSAVLSMGQNGHYQVDASINGVTIPMMIDTGATVIALSYEDADRLGLNPSGMNFSAMVMTANGPARTAYVTLPEIVVAGIRRTNIEAGISEPGKMRGSLLGMNFLSQLRSFSIKGSEMTLQD
jgi:aspartyl protease family protein